jgi:hypothetical protein
MTVTKDQAQMIAALATACRPNGARRWDHAGLMAALAKLTNRDLAEVIMATIRAARDRDCETPGVIPTNGSHWREQLAPLPYAPNVLDRSQRCSICSLSEPACRIRWHADHEFKSAAAAAKEAAETDPDAIQAALAAIRDGIEPTKGPKPVKTLDELAEENPDLHARAEAVRANMPKPLPLQEPEEAS